MRLGRISTQQSKPKHCAHVRACCPHLCVLRGAPQGIDNPLQNRVMARSKIAQGKSPSARRKTPDARAKSPRACATSAENTKTSKSPSKSDNHSYISGNQVTFQAAGEDQRSVPPDLIFSFIFLMLLLALGLCISLIHKQIVCDKLVSKVESGTLSWCTESQPEFCHLKILTALTNLRAQNKSKACNAILECDQDRLFWLKLHCIEASISAYYSKGCEEFSLYTGPKQAKRLGLYVEYHPEAENMFEKFLDHMNQTLILNCSREA